MWKNEDIRCVFGCQVGVNGDKLSQINYECVCFSACGKLGLIMRIDVSGYLCAGFDLEELGPYRLSDWQEGFFGVADPLSLPGSEHQQALDCPDEDDSQSSNACHGDVDGLRDGNLCEGDDRTDGCTLGDRPGEQGREDYANSRGRYVF